MKNTYFLFALSLLFLSSCSDRALEPDCQVPTSISSAGAGSYWIYERTVVDATGNPLSGNTTTDSLVLIGRDPSHSYQNTTALMFEDYYSNDGGKTTTKDTVYWVITPQVLYVGNIFMQKLDKVVCPFVDDVQWREYENCEAVHRTIADRTLPGDSLPSLVPDGSGGSKIIYAITQHKVKNTFDLIGSENIMVNGTSISTKKATSLLHWTFSLVEPSNATFASNGKQSLTWNDERTVWINRDIGLVKERAITTDDSGDSGTHLPQSFERRLLRYTIR